MFFKKRISKIIPQWSLHPLRFPQFWGTETFFTIKEGVFLPLRLSCKESSTFLTKPLFPQEREDVTALRCSEPLRYKVGGPSKVFAMLCGMGPHDYGLIPQFDASLPFSDIRNFIEYGITNLIIW